MATINTTTTHTTLVTCQSCSEQVPAAEAYTIALIEEIGPNHYRATGEIAHECETCETAYFQSLEAQTA